MMSRRSFVAASAAGLMLTTMAATQRAFGQLAEKPVRIVVGLPPGGPPDAVARLVAERLRERYAIGVIVENRPGAAGRLAPEVVKNSPPDGSTMLITPSPMMTLYPHVYRKLSYDPLRDLAPVTTLCSYALALSIGPAVPANVRQLDDLVTWLRAHPKQALYGSSATGSTLHFIGLIFGRAAGLELTQ